MVAALLDSEINNDWIKLALELHSAHGSEAKDVEMLPMLLSAGRAPDNYLGRVWSVA